MIYILYDCPSCKKEVSAPACPELTLSADDAFEDRTVTCPSCNAETKIELSCRFKPKEEPKKEEQATP